MPRGSQSTWEPAFQTTTTDLVETLCELMGGRVRPLYGALADRPLEPVRVADRERAFQQVGYRSRVALREGLQRTIDWYNAHPATAAKETTNA